MKSMFKGAFGALVVMLALCGLTAASALAAGAPTATTGSASAISRTEESLIGKINANGATTKYYFEYGTATSYGSRTTEGSTKGVEIKVGGAAVGLTLNTTYHFRLVATNEFGTSYGEDKTFVTAPVPPELVLAAGEKYTQFEFSAPGGSTILQWGAQSLTCTSSSFYGRFINAKELEGNMRWSECFADPQGRRECFNEKTSKEGYISSWVQSEELKGTLGYINKAKKEVGLRLAGKSSEIWANNVDCLGSTHPLTGSLGGQLSLPVNTKIPVTKAFSMVYTEKESKQTTGELGGQLLWNAGYTEFGIAGSLNGKANKEFEIQA